jgi:LysM repeat protein
MKYEVAFFRERTKYVIIPPPPTAFLTTLYIFGKIVSCKKTNLLEGMPMRTHIVAGSLFLISFFVIQMQGTQAQTPLYDIAPAPQTVYVVQSGDTLFGIARKHGIAIHALFKSNPTLSMHSTIYRGNKITIPPKMGNRASVAVQHPVVQQTQVSVNSTPNTQNNVFNSGGFTNSQGNTPLQSLKSNKPTPTQNNKCIKPKNYSQKNQHHFCMIDATVRSVIKADTAIPLTAQKKENENPFETAKKTVVSYFQKNNSLQDKVVIDEDGYRCDVKNGILVNGRNKPNADHCLIPAGVSNEKNQKIDVYFVYVHRKTGEIRASRYTIAFQREKFLGIF